MPRRIRGATSRHTCETFQAFALDGADKACETRLFNFAYDDTKGPLDKRINEFARAARRNFTAVSGFAQPQLYVLYGHGDEDSATLYSAENLPYSRSLKAKWDPKNVYGHYYPLVSLNEEVILDYINN